MSKIYPTPNQVKRLALAIDETEMEKIQTRLEDYTGKPIDLGFMPSPASLKELKKSGWEVNDKNKISQTSMDEFVESLPFVVLLMGEGSAITCLIIGASLHLNQLISGGIIGIVLIPLFSILFGLWIMQSRLN